MSSPLGNVIMWSRVSSAERKSAKYISTRERFISSRITTYCLSDVLFASRINLTNSVSWYASTSSSKTFLNPSNFLLSVQLLPTAISILFASFFSARYLVHNSPILVFPDPLIPVKSKNGLVSNDKTNLLIKSSEYTKPLFLQYS